VGRARSEFMQKRDKLERGGSRLSDHGLEEVEQERIESGGYIGLSQQAQTLWRPRTIILRLLRPSVRNL
jgi:hypothetical protein